MDLCRSYSPDCFSLDDILASNANVSCKFLEETKHLGFLDSSGQHEDVPANAKLELPLWLAHLLNVTTYKQIVSVSLPKLYRQTHRTMLDAGAEVVNLHSWGPHFYETGRHLLRLRHGEGPAIASTLVDTLRSRLRPIMDASMNLTADDMTPVTATLDELERTLFAAGQASTRRHERWMRRETAQITTDRNVMNYRKRKAAHMEA
ncbi:DNA replication complex GINS protein PSF3-like [Pollicipes pollicipes]|uniref:DNA replication complex GINS protein PSF3-like n=1 Tax=Pollicipes pollicipes TaxID=41117 RepID=UPI0018858426|nr:DNA replication complex GINS protein PSF3-like [Pollicipes pollicipes]